MVGCYIVLACRDANTLCSIGNARRISIANAKRRTLPVGRRNAANASGLKSESLVKPANVTSRPSIRINTSQINIGLDPEGHHILPQVISRDPSRHTRQEDSSRDKGPFLLTRVGGPFPASGQSPPIMVAASSQASGKFHPIMEAASSQASDLSRHTTEEANCPARDPFLLISPAERCLVSVPFRLTTVAESCRVPSRFLLTIRGVCCRVINPSLPTTPGVSCRAQNLSPLTLAAEIFQDPPLRRTTLILTMGLPIMKSRGEWAI